MKKTSPSKRSPFSQRLVELRKQHQLTMKTLGDKLGVSESFISRLESSKRHPSREFILSLEPVFFPEGDAALDELLILAGYSPINTDQLIENPDSIGLHKQYLEANPYQFKAYLSLIVALIKTGKYGAAQNRIEKGLQLFQHTVQFKALMATLELSKGNYAKALSLQEEAIETFKQDPNKRDIHTTIQDLLLNLAVIHFMQGDSQLFAYYDSEGNDKKKNKFKSAALKSLSQAKDILNQALEIVPEDVYILDEYARVCFNLALLNNAEQSQELWQATVESFLKVIHTDNRALLSQEELLQSTVYLAHAYAKQGEFKQAEHHLCLLEICLPHYWLIPYAKACLYTLKYEYSNQDNYLNLAINQLKKSITCKGKENYALEEALVDPDLKTLRQMKSLEFKELIKMENNSCNLKK